jgi:hypothetical protein
MCACAGLPIPMQDLLRAFPNSLQLDVRRPLRLAATMSCCVLR